MVHKGRWHYFTDEKATLEDGMLTSAKWYVSGTDAAMVKLELSAVRILKKLDSVQYIQLQQPK